MCARLRTPPTIERKEKPYIFWEWDKLSPRACARNLTANVQWPREKKNHKMKMRNINVGIHIYRRILLNSPYYHPLTPQSIYTKKVCVPASASGPLARFTDNDV